ncbi:MAG: hypothetical protein GDA35_05375 [Hyphomonadaceae bacterium]|nr:hypothetical protein [Hyphomonadaceae bacterium]
MSLKSMNTDTKHVREAVIRSLSAVGAIREARFYVDLFKSLKPERFAIIVPDSRCLKNPLLESLAGNIRILSDLGIYPTLVVGAFDGDPISVRFQGQGLVRELESVSVQVSKFNAASRGLVPEIRKTARRSHVPVLEMTHAGEKHGLAALAAGLKPAKVIFLQPSGGMSRDGHRVPVIDMDDPDVFDRIDPLTTGQSELVATARALDRKLDHKTVYVIASPLNLLSELFTIRGSGTLLRRSANVAHYADPGDIDRIALGTSLEAAFQRPLKTSFWTRTIRAIIVDDTYRGGAIIMKLADLPYLSKFWVTREARGEGLAGDIWRELVRHEPCFFWRSRNGNPFNDWYMQHCEGMQMSRNWRVFWCGLKTGSIARAVVAASGAPEDFVGTDGTGPDGRCK